MVETITFEIYPSAPMVWRVLDTEGGGSRCVGFLERGDDGMLRLYSLDGTQVGGGVGCEFSNFNAAKYYAMALRAEGLL